MVHGRPTVQIAFGQSATTPSKKRFGCDSQSAFLFLATETLVFYENAIRLNAEQHEQERQLS